MRSFQKKGKLELPFSQSVFQFIVLKSWRETSERTACIFPALRQPAAKPFRNSASCFEKRQQTLQIRFYTELLLSEIKSVIYCFILLIHQQESEGSLANAQAKSDTRLWMIYGASSDVTDNTGGKLKTSEAIAPWGFTVPPQDGTSLIDLRWTKDLKSWKGINC